MSTHNEAPVSAGNTAEAEKQLSSEGIVAHPPAPSTLDCNTPATRWKFDMCFNCGYYYQFRDDVRCRKFNCAIDEDARACPDFRDKYNHICTTCGEGFLSLQEAESDGCIVKAGVIDCTCWHCQ